MKNYNISAINNPPRKIINSDLIPHTLFIKEHQLGIGYCSLGSDFTLTKRVIQKKIQKKKNLFVNKKFEIIEISMIYILILLLHEYVVKLFRV